MYTRFFLQTPAKSNDVHHQIMVLYNALKISLATFKTFRFSVAGSDPEWLALGINDIFSTASSVDLACTTSSAGGGLLKCLAAYSMFPRATNARYTASASFGWLVIACLTVRVITVQLKREGWPAPSTSNRKLGILLQVLAESSTPNKKSWSLRLPYRTKPS
jgi:hypothetical protein